MFVRETKVMEDNNIVDFLIFEKFVYFFLLIFLFLNVVKTDISNERNLNASYWLYVLRNLI